MKDICNQTDEWRHTYSLALVDRLRRKSMKLAFAKFFKEINFKALRILMFAIIYIAAFGFFMISGVGFAYQKFVVSILAVFLAFSGALCLSGIVIAFLSTVWEGSCYNLAGSMKLLKDKFSLWSSDADAVHDYATLVLAAQNYQIAGDSNFDGFDDDDMSDMDK